MSNLKVAFLLVFLIFVSSCERSEYQGPPEQAANAAADFAEQLFIKHNPEKAQSFFHEEYRNMFPVPLLKLLTRHDGSHVEAVSFNDKLDQKDQILIYLEIKMLNGAILFLAVKTVGDSTTGYSLIRFEPVDKKNRNRKALPGYRFSDRGVKIVRRSLFAIFY